MAYSITYKQSVERDLRRIDRSRLKRLVGVLESKLSEDPHIGKALSGEFEGLYRIRIGDYRVVYSIMSKTVLVLRIAHRKDVYR